MAHEPSQSDTQAAWALLSKLDGMTDASIMEKVRAVAGFFAQHRAENCPPTPDPVKPKALGHLVQLDPLLVYGVGACELIARSAPGREVRDTKGRAVGRVITAWVQNDGTQVHAELVLANGAKSVARIA